MVEEATENTAVAPTDREVLEGSEEEAHEEDIGLCTPEAAEEAVLLETDTENLVAVEGMGHLNIHRADHATEVPMGPEATEVAALEAAALEAAALEAAATEATAMEAAAMGAAAMEAAAMEVEAMEAAALEVEAQGEVMEAEAYFEAPQVATVAGARMVVASVLGF